MKSTPVSEALALLLSTSVEVLKSISSHDYRTRGFIIISDDDPNFTRRLDNWRKAIEHAEIVLRQTTPRK